MLACNKEFDLELHISLVCWVSYLTYVDSTCILVNYYNIHIAMNGVQSCVASIHEKFYSQHVILLVAEWAEKQTSPHHTQSPNL